MKETSEGKGPITWRACVNGWQNESEMNIYKNQTLLIDRRKEVVERRGT